MTEGTAAVSGWLSIAKSEGFKLQIAHLKLNFYGRWNLKFLRLMGIEIQGFRKYNKLKIYKGKWIYVSVVIEGSHKGLYLGRNQT